MPLAELLPYPSGRSNLDSIFARRSRQKRREHSTPFHFLASERRAKDAAGRERLGDGNGVRPLLHAFRGAAVVQECVRRAQNQQSSFAISLVLLTVGLVVLRAGTKEAVKNALSRWGRKVGEATRKAEDLSRNTWQHRQCFIVNSVQLIIFCFFMNSMVTDGHA